MRNRSILGGLLIIVGGSLAGGLVARSDAVPDRTSEELGTYTQILSLVQARAAEPVDPRVAIEGSIRGMLRTLDPHTNYLDPEDYRGMLEEQQGSFSGLGIVISKPSNDKPLTVISPLEGTPAWKAGIRAGDVISQIEGVDTLDMTIDEALKRLKGPKGTRVTITITRPGYEELLHFTITRDEIPTNSIRQAFMIRPGIGYIKIENFTRTTDRELEDELGELQKEGMTRLVLDLRRNPGGLLEQAVRVADRFLQKNQMIVYTQGRISGSDQEYRATGESPRTQLPLVVLVDKYSASASEIVAGALQDHDRALIVGKTTWGKGLVQTVYPLSHDAALALTTARYYTPSGRLIQRDYNSLEDYLLHDEDDDDLVSHAKEIKHTDAGRTVYGGGGIRPDVMVSADQPSKFVDRLERAQAFFNFAVDFNTHHKNLPKTFEVTPATLKEFEAFLDKRKLAWTQEEMDSDREKIRGEIKEAIASALWGIEAGYRVYAETDRQIQRALELFPQAQQLASLGARARAQSSHE
ncbi:MAG TPA: S41 family peptidase [Candidatus Polarisedimenticolia bacterium]|nr:S41 family peptidase [Candidatus Polarisedimenticolia bacterium]